MTGNAGADAGAARMSRPTHHGADLTTHITDTMYRFAIGLALVAAFLLIWINGAVGIIGSEDNDANMMYAGVLAIAFFGSLIARFRPVGMAITMLVAAIAQVAVGAIAVVMDLGADGPIWPRDVVGLTGIFAAMWGTSAALFREAADRAKPAAGRGSTA